jgi:hypothetical protein
MINVSTKTCNYDNCIKQPNYNVVGEKYGKFCVAHKLDNMIDVKHLFCKFEGCKIRPNYNSIGEKKGKFCVSHKLENMINVESKTCKYNGCLKQPSYNYENEKISLYCVEHKNNDMVDVKSYKCENIECKKQPIYNYKNSILARFCNMHKLDNMINIKNKKCLMKNCETIPYFNYASFKNGLYCSIHKLDGMINVKDKLCSYISCKTKASFNFKNIKTRLYCSIHKLEGMINLNEKLCKTILCNTSVRNPKYKGYCMRCFIHLFPDKPVTRNYKTKESSVATFVTENFPNFTWNIDKTIQDGCSRRRPDLICDLGYQVIIVEIDENQHNKYDCSCENKRIMELSQDVGHRPIVFIRFNPDDYIDASNKNITSCWGLTPKTGLLKIRDKKQTEWNNRLNTLKQQIEYWCNEDNKIEKTIEIIQLFYDEIDNINKNNIEEK